MRRLPGGVGRPGIASAHSREEAENLNDTFNMANRLEAFNIMGSTGHEADKNKSRFACAAAGGKESTDPEGTKMSEEILRQLADLTVLMSSFRRDLDRQQQEITTLKVSYKPSYSVQWNTPLTCTTSGRSAVAGSEQLFSRVCSESARISRTGAWSYSERRRTPSARRISSRRHLSKLWKKGPLCP